MAQFTVRNFDDQLYQKLKERAVLNQRSLEAEVRSTLIESLTRLRPHLSPAEREERIKRMEAIRASIKPNDLDALKILREDRDRDLK